MASSTGTFSAFQRVGPSNCGTNSSFSIRRILDLPEQRDEKCVAYSSSSSSPECCPPALPLGPRVACPVIHNYDYNVPCTEILNWQHLGFTTYPNHWSYRSFPLRKEGFSLGKWINIIENVRKGCRLECPCCSSFAKTTEREPRSLLVFLFRWTFLSPGCY